MNEIFAVQKLVPLPKEICPKLQISCLKQCILETLSNWSIRSVDGKSHTQEFCYANRLNEVDFVKLMRLMKIFEFIIIQK